MAGAPNTDEPSWDLVPYAPELEEQARALCRRTWGDVEIADEAYHRWQYQENPAGQALSAFARDGETLVAQFGAVPLRMAVDGRTALGALALNVATDEAYRGRGAFVAAARLAGERMASAGVELAWALPNENSFPGFVRRLGYRHVGDVPLLVRPVNVRRLVSERLPLPGVGALAAMLARALLRPVPRTQTPEDGISIEPVDGFDAAFDGLWERVRGRQRVMVVRDATYLSWRFRRIPIRRYEVLRANVDGRLAGYIVLRLAEIAGMQAGLVVDFIVEPSEAGDRAGRALLSHALARFADEDIDLLASLMLPHAPEYRLLRHAGFWPLPRPLLPQRFRVVARGPEQAYDLGNWYLTMGDYDVV